MLDRNYQKELLEDLRECYPAEVGGDLLRDRHNEMNSDGVADGFIVQTETEAASQKLLFTLNYLHEHGLIKTTHGNLSTFVPNARITAKGIDFLANDGGLSAILNTVTVKFDLDNVRELVETGLLTANVPEEKQGALKKAIQEAPGTVLQTAVSTIVGQGMSSPVETAKAVAGLFGISW